MRLLTMLLFLLFFTIAHIQAEDISFLVPANEKTSLMHYEFHMLAMEAAKEKDFENAFRIYEKIAHKEDAQAEYNLGMMYLKGIGTQQNKTRAYKWLRRASKHGSLKAGLFFEQMQQSHEEKRLERINKTVNKPLSSSPIKDTNATKNQKTSLVSKNTINGPDNEQQQSNNSFFYLLGVLIVLSILIFFLIRYFLNNQQGHAHNNKSAIKTQAHIYEGTVLSIKQYHKKLLEFSELDRFNNQPDKMKIYYMFIAGAIDYFCQGKGLSENQERRIFTDHISSIEGKENLTAITQTILEGQKESTLYHAKAAGGVSAAQWDKTGSNTAFLVLKKLLVEES